MRSKQQLRDEGVKYEEWRFNWMPESYRVETCEFSEDFEWMRYGQYLELWKERMGGDYEIIKDHRVDRDFLNLVKLKGDE